MEICQTCPGSVVQPHQKAILAKATWNILSKDIMKETQFMRVSIYTRRNLSQETLQRQKVFKVPVSFTERLNSSKIYVINLYQMQKWI